MTAIIDLHEAAQAIHYQKCMRYKVEPWCVRHGTSWLVGETHCPNNPTDLLTAAQQLLDEVRVWRHNQQHRSAA